MQDNKPEQRTENQALIKERRIGNETERRSSPQFNASSWVDEGTPGLSSTLNEWSAPAISIAFTRRGIEVWLESSDTLLLLDHAEAEKLRDCLCNSLGAPEKSGSGRMSDRHE